MIGVNGRWRKLKRRKIYDMIVQTELLYFVEIQIQKINLLSKYSAFSSHKKLFLEHLSVSSAKTDCASLSLPLTSRVSPTPRRGRGGPDGLHHRAAGHAAAEAHRAGEEVQELHQQQGSPAVLHGDNPRGWHHCS